MSPNALNVFAVLLSVGLSAAGAALGGREVSSVEPEAASTTERGADVLVDARGRKVRTGPYRRIVSLHTVADALLLDLVEPDRLVGVSAYTLETNPISYRFGAKHGISRSKDVESVLALRPNLVIVSKFADEAYLTRLRERGVEVFDLGEMRGVRDTVANIRTLATLLELPRRGERIARDYIRNLAALEAAVSDQQKPWGIYLSVLGDSLFGGTVGSSYGDLLYYGGVRDLAEARGFSGWPRYSPEQLIALDPAVIVTSKGRTRMICGHALLERLSACDSEGRIIEMPERNHSDPGLGLVDAAQYLQTVVHRIEPNLRNDRGDP